MKLLRWGMIALAIILLAGCSGDKTSDDPYAYRQDLIESNRSLRTIDQGVYGTVLWWSGDFMPAMGSDRSSGTVEPYSDSVFAFTAFSSRDTALFDGFVGYYWNLTAPIVGRTFSTSNGFYQISLPAGDYTVLFRVADDTLYGGRSSDNGIVMKVSVTEGQTVEFDYDI